MNAFQGLLEPYARITCTCGSEGSGAQQCAPLTRLLSPLLANIALSALDDHFDQQWQQQMGTKWRRERRKKNGQGNWRLVRYCDNFVLMVAGDRHHAEAPDLRR